jgi:hypothetical protein
LLGATLLVALGAADARAADCPADSRDTAAERADVIAAARVVAVDAQKVTLAVQRLFKGDSDWQIEVALPAGDTTFRAGESYLVFAARTDQGLALGPCSGTLPHAEAGAVIDVLGPGHKPGAGGKGGAQGTAPAPPPSAAPTPIEPAQPPPSAGGCAACSFDRGGSAWGLLPLFALGILALVWRRRLPVR